MLNKISSNIHYLTLALLLQLSAMAALANPTDNSGHEHHKTAVGIHGMALFTDGEQFYASHMPLANSIHAHQVIFSFSLNKTSKQKLKDIFANNALVSLMPERFDLMKLMDGTLTSFKGELFAGHFERGGKSMLNNVTVKVEKMMLSKDLATDTDDNGQYFFIKTKGKSGFLVHRIVAAPSFDQIVQASMISTPEEVSEEHLLLTITNGAPIIFVKPKVIKTNGFEVKLGMPLYLETNDFQ